ncbi:hypothetical protein ABW19_dt0204605 [Dactylella cylindrospora]|nr:hypothetical protein ABW19_dt0204605 [Dactylella cylindrospora]
MNDLSLETERELSKLYGPYFLPTDEHYLPAGSETSQRGAHRRRKRLNILEFTEPRDLISFGFLPEFIGRLPVVAALDTFDEEMLVRVLSEPRNSLLKQYEQLFEMSGVELKFTSQALRDISKAALTMDTGKSESIKNNS